MEELERGKLEDYQKKKLLEKGRKQEKRKAHEKVCCRQISKLFNKNLKFTGYLYLRDCGFFVNHFKENVLAGDVLPWLLDQTEKFVEQKACYGQYPDVVVKDFVNDVSKAHCQKVKEHEDKLKKAREDEESRLATKHADKLRRKADKIAQKKAEEIENLKQHVLANYVEKGALTEGILA